MSNKRHKNSRAKIGKKKQQLNPAKQAAIMNQAVSLHQTGDSAKASLLYTQVLRANPSNVDALHFQAVLQFHSGEQKNAVALLRKSIDLDPTNPASLNNLGNMLKTIGELDSANEMYQQAHILAPDAIDPLINLGVLARSRQDYKDAKIFYLKALQIAENHPIANQNMANLLGTQGEFEDALKYLNLALQHSSNTEDNRHTRLRIAHCYHSLKREPEAVAIYEQLLQLNPNDSIANHMLTALTGTDVPGKPEESYVKELFDRFSETFDECLDNLGYQAPRLVGELVIKHYPGDTVQLRIMDAGCGTGLCAKFLHKRAEKLVGVDLSPGMLKQAEMLEQYDQLVEDDLVRYLGNQKIAGEEIDLLISADTLCYFGDLRPFMSAAVAVMAANSRIIFTVEKIKNPEQGDFSLEPHGRYSHSSSYIEQIFESERITLESLEVVVLRKESGEEVLGYLVSGKRDGTNAH